MKRLLDHEEVFEGKGQDLRLATEGLSLVPHKEEAGAPQVARYEEVAQLSLMPKGRGLQIAFADGREDWTVQGLQSLSAQWAFALLDTNVRRASHRQVPLFTQRLDLPSLPAAFGELVGGDHPDPYLLGQALLQQAIRHQATDIHLEHTAQGAGEGKLSIHFRVDGQLQEAAQLPLEVSRRALSAIKVAADMPNYETTRPQTGRLSVPAEERIVDMRLTSMPTAAGEKLTIRLFDPAVRPHDLEKLGLEPEVLTRYRELLAGPQGCILLTGPAGSGKSTTMYASLEAIKRQASWRHIATVEEPVEYLLPGIQQTEVNREGGLDFAQVLRVILRQDPQVIMVGEIRDPETAEIAVQAGLTGHLMFSTVHAPSAVGVFVRLADLGVEPYLLMSSVSAVIAQRLVRRLCPACAQPHQPSAEELAAVGLGPEAAAGGFRRPGACNQCHDGYSGRTGLFALLPVTAEIRQAVMDRRPAYQIEQVAAELPPGGLWEAGLRKAARGEVSLEELVRVLGRREV